MPQRTLLHLMRTTESVHVYKHGLLKLVSIFFFIFFLFLAFCGQRRNDDIRIPFEKRIKIWDSIAGKDNYKTDEDRYTATFEKDGHSWTILAADLPIVAPTIYPAKWLIKGDSMDILAIPEPITNYKILPFTEKIENAVSSDKLEIVGAPDSYEPASFLIRSGDKDLQDVMVEVSDLEAEATDKAGTRKKSMLPKDNIDIRVVKCWYQAGVGLWDIRHKTLTPELLIHDDNLVEVDHNNQTNLIRDFEHIRDAESLKPFTIPRNQNKQVWLTIHIPEKTKSGNYIGKIVISSRHFRKELKLSVKVLPFTLEKPILDYALFYDGHLTEKNEPELNCRLKTVEQLLNELTDMKEHGLTNVPVWHQLNPDRTLWHRDWEILRQTLEIRRQIGWGEKPLLYLDWRLSLRKDLRQYKEKINKIVTIANSFGIKDIYIYGSDEKEGKELLGLRELYKTVHEAGAKNFVACKEDFMIFVPDLLDIPILHGQPHRFFLSMLKKNGIRAWSYGNPQAGLEEPETYRYNYGLKLFLNHFSGACNFTYQGSFWHDVVDNKTRSHSMTYPTVNKPIPTIQWEGWRQGVNDIRYLGTAIFQGKPVENLINDKITPAEYRRKVIKEMLTP